MIQKVKAIPVYDMKASGGQEV